MAAEVAAESRRRGVKRGRVEESEAEFLKRPGNAATIEAPDYLWELGLLLKQLPERWRAAANLVEELGVTAEIQIALAFCRWCGEGQQVIPTPLAGGPMRRGSGESRMTVDRAKSPAEADRPFRA